MQLRIVCAATPRHGSHQLPTSVCLKSVSAALVYSLPTTTRRTHNQESIYQLIDYRSLLFTHNIDDTNQPTDRRCSSKTHQRLVSLSFFVSSRQTCYQPPGNHFIIVVVVVASSAFFFRQRSKTISFYHWPRTSVPRVLQCCSGIWW